MHVRTGVGQTRRDRNVVEVVGGRHRHVVRQSNRIPKIWKRRRLPTQLLILDAFIHSFIDPINYNGRQVTPSRPWILS